VWRDEVTVNDPAKELALNGHFRSSVFTPYWGFDQAYFWVPPGQPLLMALVYKGFGFGLWSTRLPGVVLGAGVLALLYLFSLQLFQDRRAAFWSAVVFGLDPLFILTVRSGRMDTQCLFLALLGAIFYLHAETHPPARSRWLMASGLAVGLAGITHPLGAAWALALGLLLAVSNRGPRWRDWLAYAFFTILPSLLWLTYAGTAPQLFLEQFVYHREAYLAHGSLLARPLMELARYVQLDKYQLVPFLLLGYFGSFLWMLLKGPAPRSVRLKLLLLFAVLFLFNSLVMTKGHGYYFLHPNLILALSLGFMIRHFLPERFSRAAPAREFARLLPVALLILNELLLGLGGRYLALAYQWHARDYRTVENAIRQNIPPGSIVWGAPEVWYALVKVGATLRLAGSADPRAHDYAIVKLNQVVLLGRGFHKIGQLGQPLPPLFGRITLWSADYQMQIWQSDLRPPPRFPGPEPAGL
jgi:4-amino-4-deoxy-L-arabinose transferase-like glycosyltransferase